MIAVKLYRRARPIIDAVKVTAANVQEVSSFAKKAVVEPLLRRIEWLADMFKGKEGGTDEQ